MKFYLKCKNCGFQFYVTCLSSTNHKFCSKYCARKYLGSRHKAPWLTEQNKLKNVEQGKRCAKKISEAHHSKPRSVNSKHYKKVMGEHEHRTVAAKLLGRKLTKDEIVHHRDENKRNNSPENLVVMTRSEHAKVHWWGKQV